jgi:hypothetical protein
MAIVHSAQVRRQAVTKAFHFSLPDAPPTAAGPVEAPIALAYPFLPLSGNS